MKILSGWWIGGEGRRGVYIRAITSPHWSDFQLYMTFNFLISQSYMYQHLPIKNLPYMNIS